MDSVCAFVAKGQGIAQVSSILGMSRVPVHRPADWQDRRCNRRNEETDAEVLSRILNIIGDMPIVGYRRYCESSLMVKVFSR